MQRWLQNWRQYRYRFLPWIMLNFKDRSVRSVTKNDSDQIISDQKFQNFLLTFLTSLDKGLSDARVMTPTEKHARGLEVMRDCLGFCVQRTESTLPLGGLGVLVTDGIIPRQCVTSLYPGLVYQPYDPVLFQSIQNPFIFRCVDRVLIDGNDKGLSKSLFNSCYGRDSFLPWIQACDNTWLTNDPVCPLNIGQYVNNQTKESAANVAYQEFTLPEDFPPELRKYIPNNHFSPSLSSPENIHRPLKLIALISLDDIECGQELFSSYFTIVR